MTLRTFLIVLGLALTGLAAPTAASAMTFTRINEDAGCKASVCVVAAGEIRKDTAKAFRTFVRNQHIPAGALVVFDSHGGRLLQSLELGKAIRAAGLYTAVGRYDRDEQRFDRGGECISACAYAFLGGVQRDVDDYARLGVHQFACDPGMEPSLSVSDAQALMGLISIYTDKMVGKSAIVMLAARTPPTGTHWLSDHELRSYRVVTN
jgi:hypothetical protein